MSTGTWMPQVGDRHSDDAVKAFYDNGFWRHEVLTDLLERWCERQPDQTFVSDGDGSLTYAELRGQAYRLAAALRQRGIGAGDRVVVQLPNWREFVVLYVALARIGAVMVPVMPVYRHDEVGYIASFAGAKAIVTPGVFRNFDHLAMIREIRPQCPALDLVLTVRAGPGSGPGARGVPGDEVALADLTRPEAGAEVPDDVALGLPPGPDDGHLTIFTSGTEARPKGCVHTFNTLGTSARELARILAVRPGDVVFMPSPVAHATGLAVGLTVPLVAGAAAHFLDVWDPAVALQRIAEHGCTATVTAAPFVQMALDAFDSAVHDISSLRAWGCGGAPVPPAMVERMATVWPGCHLLSLYGRSETFLTTMCEQDDPVERSSGSDGRPPAPVELAILGDDGNELPPGEDGEIVQRGAGVMLGYFGDPERTAATFDNQGWCHSGDRGRMDADGYLRVTGRIKDIIIRGGSNISAREVEDHLVSHPKVAQVAVVGMPDRVLGERVCAFVVPAGEPPGLGELTDFLRHERRIAAWKLPEHLELIESLPMTATGKVQKFALRDRLGTTGANNGT